MTYNPHFKRANPRRRGRVAAVALVAALALLLAAAAYARGPLGELLWRALAPALAARDALGSSDAAVARAELARLQAQLADRDALYRENLELKAMLGRAAGRSVIAAAVIQRPPGVPYDTLMVDAGSAHGVLPGSLVSMGGSALVGTVTEVYESMSRVALYSSAGEVHAGTLIVGGPSTSLGTGSSTLAGTSKSVPVSVMGQGSGSMRTQVPAGTGAKPGDAVLLPSIGMGLTARVSHVEAREGESFETVYLSLPADLNARFVEIWQ